MESELEMEMEIEMKKLEIDMMSPHDRADNLSLLRHDKTERREREREEELAQPMTVNCLNTYSDLCTTRASLILTSQSRSRRSKGNGNGNGNGSRGSYKMRACLLVFNWQRHNLSLILP